MVNDTGRACCFIVAVLHFFLAYLHLDQAKESGYLSFSPVEDTVAGYLSPASPMMRLGQRHLLPTRVARHQAALAEKAYLATGQAACSTNTALLLQCYQAKLLTELPSSLGSGHETVVEHPSQRTSASSGKLWAR